MKIAPSSVHRPRIDRCRHAFSLVELLVIVAVVVILISLLFPVGFRAIEKAQGAQCANNLRQIGSGLFAYTADHGGDLVPCVVLYNNYYWFDMLNPYMGFPQYDQSYAFPAEDQKSDIFPLKWQQCAGKRFKDPTREKVGYGWNGMNFGLDPSHGPGAWGINSKISQVTKPSHTIIVGDSRDGDEPRDAYQHRYLCPPPDPPGDTNSGNPWPLPERHGGRGFYLMLDGHVQALTPKEIEQDPTIWKKVQ